MQGRRVTDGSYQALTQPGDYSVTFHGDEVAGLWLWVPGAPEAHSHIAAEGHGSNDEPEWTITLDEDGSVTVDPSIDCWWGQEEASRWHGHLQHGVWT